MAQPWEKKYSSPSPAPTTPSDSVDSGAMPWQKKYAPGQGQSASPSTDISSTQDSSPSVFDTMRTNLQNNTQDLKPVLPTLPSGGPTTVGSVADRAGGALHDYVAAPLVHMMNRAGQNIATPLIGMAENTFQPAEQVQARREAEAQAAWDKSVWNPNNKSNTPVADTAEAIGNSVPLAPGLGSQIRGYANSAHPISDIGGDALTAGLIGGIAKTAPEGSLNPVTALQNKFRPKSDPSIVPPIQTAAEKLTTAIVPKSGRAPQFTNDLIDQLPNVKDYAKRTNNPLNTQAEFEQALKGAGDERFQHYKKEILDPNKDVPVTVDDRYNGVTKIPGKATIGDINSRISRINKLLSPNYAKINPGDVATAMAKTTPEALLSENGYLQDLLHKNLSEQTGVSPEAIGSLRKDFGKLKDLKNTVSEARTGRMVGVGASNEGGAGGGIGLPHPSPAGVATKLVEKTRGGRSTIADKAFRDAWQELGPLAGKSNTLPTSPAGYLDSRTAAAEANRQAALQQATHSANLEQAAQDAATGRSRIVADRKNIQNTAATNVNKDLANREAIQQHQLGQAAQDASISRGNRAADLRSSKAATNQEQTKLEGEAARTIGRDNALRAQGAYRQFSTGSNGKRLGSMDGKAWYDIATGQQVNHLPSVVPPPPR